MFTTNLNRGHTREPDPTHSKLKHTTTRKTAVDARAVGARTAHGTALD